ncbi:hypothetical protein IAQ61_009447 [Plenodomus lingam]|uniref:uncharacterized protein n=1 Tax=Leptosphaeria maculans TaxID=5022 RepID=UPI003328DBEB|nr:hypothetical protein IAQ61_009447 [Plenodomus lingam]
MNISGLTFPPRTSCNWHPKDSSWDISLASLVSANNRMTALLVYNDHNAPMVKSHNSIFNSTPSLTQNSRTASSQPWLKFLPREVEHRVRDPIPCLVALSSPHDEQKRTLADVR